jgi:hypothetical protein
MKSAIQRYYDSEINAALSWFRGEEFVIYFGNKVNNFIKDVRCATWEEVEKVFEEELNNGSNTNK